MHTNLFPKMKIFLLVFLVCVFCFQVNFTHGHDPEAMTLDYDFTAQTLEVYIEHVIGPGEGDTHYISKILIYKSIYLVQEHDYTSQSSNTLTFHYAISASHLDYIKVTACCSLGGNISKFLIAYDPESTIGTTITTGTLDSFQLLPTSSTILSIALLMIIIKTINHKRNEK